MLSEQTLAKLRALASQRASRDVGGPWMRADVVPLLSRDTERTVGEVIASAQQPQLIASALVPDREHDDAG